MFHKCTTNAQTNKQKTRQQYEGKTNSAFIHRVHIKWIKISIICRTYESWCTIKKFLIPSTKHKYFVCISTGCLLILFCFFCRPSQKKLPPLFFSRLFGIFFDYSNFPYAQIYTHWRTHTHSQYCTHSTFFFASLNCMQQTLFSASPQKEWHKCLMFFSVPWILPVLSGFWALAESKI